jgi:hypothetical protein
MEPATHTIDDELLPAKIVPAFICEWGPFAHRKHVYSRSAHKIDTIYKSKQHGDSPIVSRMFLLFDPNAKKYFSMNVNEIKLEEDKETTNNLETI